MGLRDAVDDLMTALCTEQVLMERLDPETRKSQVDYGYESLTDEEIAQRAQERRDQIYAKIMEKRSKLYKGRSAKKARDAVDEVMDGMSNEEILLLEPQIGPINKLIETFEELPDTEDMATAALAGGAKRGWYRDSAQAISEIFGADAPRFVALLAATSPNVTVSDNLRHTSRIWEAWENAGRPVTLTPSRSCSTAIPRRRKARSLSSVMLGSKLVSRPKRKTSARWPIRCSVTLRPPTLSSRS